MQVAGLHIKVAGILYETDGDRFIPGAKRL
jgi:hypothetical protein